MAFNLAGMRALPLSSTAANTILSSISAKPRALRLFRIPVRFRLRSKRKQNKQAKIRHRTGPGNMERRIEEQPIADCHAKEAP